MKTKLTNQQIEDNRLNESYWTAREKWIKIKARVSQLQEQEELAFREMMRYANHSDVHG